MLGSRFLRDSTNSSWTTFTDSDEFIVAKKNKNIHEVGDELPLRLNFNN